MRLFNCLSRSLPRILLISLAALPIVIFCGVKVHTIVSVKVEAATKTTAKAANTPPKITPISPLIVGQGYTNFDMEIASVTDTETPAKDLRVTITSGTQAISLVGLSNNNGKIVTQIYVPCSIAFGTYPIGLKVTDGDGLEGATEFVIIVNKINTAPVIADYPATVNIASGGTTFITPLAPPQDDAPIRTLKHTVISPGFDGTLTIDYNSGVVNIFSPRTAGSYKANVTVTDWCGLATTKSFTINVTGTPPCPTSPSLRMNIYGLGHSQDWTWLGNFGDNIGSVDFNSDGKPDFVITTEAINHFSILLSNRDNRFNAAPDSPVIFTSSAPIRTVAVGEFNGDGNSDLVVMADNLRILLGDGKGRFTQASNSPMNVVGSSVLAGDFNNDGKTDLVLPGEGKISVLMGAGNGTFTPSTNNLAAAGYIYPAAGDFNSDGKLDLVISSRTTKDLVILLGDGNGGFTQPSEGKVNLGEAGHLRVDDFNKDGKLDIAILTDPSGNLHILLGNGTGRFLPAPNSPISMSSAPVSAASPWTINTGDVNGDNVVDLVVGRSEAINILFGNADGTFTRQPDIPISNLWALAIGDFTDDKKVDIAGADPFTGFFRVLAGRGDGTFITTTLTVPNTPPKLGTYESKTLKLGDSLTLTPTALPEDDNDVVSLEVTAPGFAGTLSIDKTTGVVSVANAGPLGKYTVTVKATDNCGAVATTTFTLDVAFVPDLQVQIQKPPVDIVTDTNFSLSWVLKNAGNLRIETPFTDRVVLSTSPTPNIFNVLADFPFAQPLDPNQSVTRTQILNIPRDKVVADGNYYLIVMTDVEDKIKEGTGENNNFHAVPIKVRRSLLPDLVVSTIEAPDEAFFGQTITVKWTVKNIGNGLTNAAQWQDWVYLSTDDIPEIEDPFKIAVENVSYLAAGESYVASANIRIPFGLVGTYNVLLFTDNGKEFFIPDAKYNVIEENENNNRKTRPIRITVPVLPDLQVTSVVAPEEGFTGGQLPLNWRVENKGTGNTPSDQMIWEDSIYLSKDNKFDATDRLIGNRKREAGLSKGDGYDVSGFNVTIPGDIAGDWFVFVVADGGNAVYEFDKENNNTNYDQRRPVKIKATPPDLITEWVTVPLEGTAARQISAKWKVTNQNPFPTKFDWVDTIYLSPDETPDPKTDKAVGSLPHAGILQPGQTYEASTTVALTACISGKYFLYAYADSGNVEFEYSASIDAEANNASKLQAVQILALPPDLQVTNVTNDVSGNAGQPFNFSYTVTNKGIGATVETQWTDNVYLSPTQTFDEKTALLAGGVTRIGDVLSNNAYINSTTLIVPIHAQGEYFVFLKTDAGSNVEECDGENNNLTLSPVKINVKNNLPDFTVTNIQPLNNIFSGQPVTVNWTVNNVGTVNANNQGWQDSVFFSPTNKLSDATRLTTVNKNGPLNIGASYTNQAQVTIPVLATAGTYYLIIQTDSSDAVFEGQREDNNTNFISIPVTIPPTDLAVTNVDAPEQGFSGQFVNVKWTVANNGTQALYVTNWTDYVFLSADQIFDPNTDLSIGHLPHDGALAAGASYNANVDVRIPPGITGPFYVFVQTDRNHLVADNNLANNAGYDATPMVSQFAPPADLIVSTINVPATGGPGEKATMQWSVKNQGINPALGQWTDAVYLSKDTTWDSNDAVIGHVDHIGDIAKEGTYNGMLNTELPAVLPSEYYVIVRTDVRNFVRENDETNNAGASSAKVKLDVPELTLGVAQSGTLGFGQERYYKVNAPANETLRFTLDGNRDNKPQLPTNELYARFGLLPSRSAYDFLFNRPYESDQEIVVPDTQAGTYYSLARNAYLPANAQTDPYSIKAEIVPFGITSVSPNRIGDNGQVTITIKGAKFENGSTVKLVKGNTTLMAAKVWAVDSATIKARFLFEKAPLGTYDIVLSKSNNSITTAIQIITVELARADRDLTVNGDLRPRAGRPLFANSLLRNTGNIDLPYVVVIGSYDGDVNIGWIMRPEGALPNTALFPNADWQTDSPTAHIINGITRDSFIIRDFEVSGEYQFTMRAAPVKLGGFSAKILATAYSQIVFEDSLQKRFEAWRQWYLNNPTYFAKPDIKALLDSPSIWWRYIREEYVKLGILDPITNTKVGNRVKSNSPTLEADDACGGLDLAAGLRHATCVLKCNAIPSGPGKCDVLGALGDKIGGAAGYGCNVAELFNCFQECDCEDLKLPCYIDPLNPGKWISCPNGSQPQSPGSKKLSINKEDSQILENGGMCLPPGNGGSRACGEGVRAADPNEKIGPKGYGSSGYLEANQTWPYTINFENVPTASALAQRIRITDQLDPNLDWRTFRLKEIGFGKYRIPIPDNRAFYQGRLQLGEDLGNLVADISAGLDIATGQVTWTLTALDPKTGEQPNGADHGLLPPNDSTGRGQGYVTYTVQPKAEVKTGTVIANSATIIFDTEEPITTNTVTNTIDADVPTSAVNPLPATSATRTFTVSWAGSDPANGSGLQSFDVWYVEGDGAYQPLLSGTTDTSTQFTGQAGKSYRFYSIARDNAGNVEAAPAAPDAVTTIGQVNNPAPTLASLSPNALLAGANAFTLTVTGANFVPESQVLWNGAARTTNYVSATELTATISAADVANAGAANVTVASPTPGGGTTAALAFAIQALGYEADVAPRPNGNGNGTVTIVDWVQVGRFVAGLDTPTAGSEFQRADCAPRPTLGDGRISVADWVQAGRYAAGLDSVFVSGGLTAAINPSGLQRTEATASVLRLANAKFTRGQIVSVPIELEAQGTESGIAFSLNYDPNVMRFLDAAVGNGATGAALQINTLQAANGRIGIAMVLPAGQTIANGTKTLLNLRFLPGAGDSEAIANLTFGDQLIPREIADVRSFALPQVNYVNGAVTLSGRGAATVSGASYASGDLAPDSIVSSFGLNLSSATMAAPSLPLPTSLGGTQVIVKDSKGVERLAPLFYVSPAQLNFLLPKDTADGVATLAIQNGSGVVTAGVIQVGKVSPALFTAEATGQGVAAASMQRVKPDGTQSYEEVYFYDAVQKKYITKPIDLGSEGEQAYLLLFGTGIRLREDITSVGVNVGGVPAEITYAGAHGFFVGVDQVNVKLPRTLTGRKEVDVALTVAGKIANTVKVSIK